jgi:peptide-methionine (S)-S-oxide reductase
LIAQAFQNAQGRDYERMMGRNSTKPTYSRGIVTRVAPFHGFYPAEMYHQHYLQSHFDQPYVVYNDLSKLAALKKQYPQMSKR